MQLMSVYEIIAFYKESGEESRRHAEIFAGFLVLMCGMKSIPKRRLRFLIS